MLFNLLNKKQIIILLIIVFSMLVISGYGYWYFNVKNYANLGMLNVNKSKIVNKITTNTVFSDLYYRITKYEDSKRVSEYSEIIPVKSQLGYDFTDIDSENISTLPSSKIISSTIIRNKIQHYLGENSTDIEKYIQQMKIFSEVYSEIVATQDQDYFDFSKKSIEKILEQLYSEKNGLKPINIKDFYKVDDLDAIPNMRLNYFKKNTNYSLINRATKEVWKPSIIEFGFNEKDKVKIKYVDDLTIDDTNEYVNSILKTSSWYKYNKKKTFTGVVIKTVKIIQNKPEIVTILIEKNSHAISAYQTDANGHLYLIRLYTQTNDTMLKSLPKFLQLVFGIEFSESNTTNKYVLKSREVDNSLIELCKLTEDYEDIIERYDELKKYDLTTAYNLKIRLKSVLCMNSSIKKDAFLEQYKNIFHDYPNQSNLEQIKIEIENIKIVYDALDRKKGFFNLNIDGAADKLKKECSSIECIKQIIK